MFTLPSYVRPNQIRTTVCPLCDTLVDALDAERDNVVLSRVDGDSANGYEVFHRDCLVDLDQK